MVDSQARVATRAAGRRLREQKMPSDAGALEAAVEWLPSTRHPSTGSPPRFASPPAVRSGSGCPAEPSRVHAARAPVGHAACRAARLPLRVLAWLDVRWAPWPLLVAATPFGVMIQRMLLMACIGRRRCSLCEPRGGLSARRSPTLGSALRGPGRRFEDRWPGDPGRSTLRSTRRWPSRARSRRCLERMASGHLRDLELRCPRLFGLPTRWSSSSRGKAAADAGATPYDSLARRPPHDRCHRHAARARRHRHRALSGAECARIAEVLLGELPTPRHAPIAAFPRCRPASRSTSASRCSSPARSPSPASTCSNCTATAARSWSNAAGARGRARRACARGPASSRSAHS